MVFFLWMLNILHVSMPYLTLLLKFIKHLFTSVPSFNPSLNNSPSFRPLFHRTLPWSWAQHLQSQPIKAVSLANDITVMLQDFKFTATGGLFL